MKTFVFFLCNSMVFFLFVVVFVFQTIQSDDLIAWLPSSAVISMSFAGALAEAVMCCDLCWIFFFFLYWKLFQKQQQKFKDIKKQKKKQINVISSSSPPSTIVMISPWHIKPTHLPTPDIAKGYPYWCFKNRCHMHA